ncbi:hypothetical protein [Micromonospora sp. U21]|uniref:hypothetical protein n=1 Tax=Micromonospora sp. U21 TaxID=2824899 RepID=UPI0027DE87D7|nr:hypothetical protein [Micromonospora sp. U21]
MVGGESLGDGEEADAGEELGEDSPDDGRGLLVGCEALEVFAVGGLGGVGVGSEVAECVAVGRASAEVAVLEEGLGGHGGADAEFDAVAFALAHAAEDGHDQFVCLVVGVDGAADLGHPELDAVVGEQRHREAGLIAVEGAVRFADDDGGEPAPGVAQRREEKVGLGSALPR